MMRSFVRILFAVMTASLILVPPVFGQGPDGPPPDGGPGGRNLTPEQMIRRRVEMLDRQLDLTPAQEKKITEILTKAEETRSTEKPDSTISRRDRLRRARNTVDNREKVDTEIKKVLTPEQAKKYAEMSRTRGRFGVDGQMKQLTERLKLTVQQQKEIRAILEKRDAETRKMFRDGGQNGDREAMRAAFEKQREETDRQIEAHLTAPQKKEYAAMRKERTERMRERRGDGQSE